MTVSRKRRYQKKLRSAGGKHQESSPLPAYLLQKPPPPTTIPPPVHARHQELPFEKLSWDNFERLCKTLVETDHEIRSCRFYGRPGQMQRGIDLIAYPQDFREGRPRVYQCKRVETFRSRDINGTVDKLLKSNWKPLPTHFVLCCRSSLRSTEYQDEILKQSARLQKRKITFEVWDGEELSTKLKDHPKIVDEFFGREWVTAFNGRDAAEALERRFESRTARLTDQPDQVGRLLLSRDLEIQDLRSTLDLELSRSCDQIKEEYKQGRHFKALRDLQSYIDRFQTDLRAASPSIRARFWYSVGVFTWQLPGGRDRASQCLETARRIDPNFDLRPLEARVLFAGGRHDEALQVLRPIDTLPVLTLSLAMLLDLGQLSEFDALWSASTIEPDDVAYQLLAYRHRLDRQFDKAHDAIHKAIDRAPKIPAHYVAAGHITFWAAVPAHLDEIPRTTAPVAFHPIFYRPTDRQIHMLEEAVKFYNQAISLLSGVRSEEADQIRELQAYQLCCWAYHPQQQVQARELALNLLTEDPGNFSALLYCVGWAVPFDADRSIDALETKRLEGDVTLNNLHMLTKLYDLQGHTERAIHLLELERPRFTRENAQHLWIGSAVELLVKRKDISGATALLESYQPDDPLLKRRLEAQLYDRLDDPRRLEEVAVQLYKDSRATLDLLNLCGFYRKTEQWNKLEPYASQLVDRSPDSGSISLLAHALYHNRRFEECLALLEKHSGQLLDAKLPDDLRRIRIECLFKLNRLNEAITHLEAVLHEHPDSSVIQNLAHVYFRMGKREKAVAVLREASEAPWAEATLRLATSQLLLQESPEEAFQLAQRVRDESPGDERVWLHYIQAGFLSGHDREASEALLSFQTQFPETSLLQRLGLEDVITRVNEWRRDQLERWNLYRSAKAPIHSYSDAERQPLGLHWFTSFHFNKSVNRWDQKYPLFIRYGGRAVGEAGLSHLNARGVIIDYTALLLAYELNLLPLVEKVFPRILIPPSLLTVIQMEVQTAEEHQPSRLEGQQQIKTAIDTGRIGVIVENITENALQRFQVGDLGLKGASLFFLAEKHRGVVLVQHLLREEEGGYVLSEPLAGLRVFPREVLTAVSRMGALAQHELSDAIQFCRDEPCREKAVQALERQPLLVTDEVTLAFFAGRGILDRLTGTFKVSMPASEAESITQTLRDHQLRQSAADRLDGLRRYVSNRLNQHYYFPSCPVEVDKKELGQTCGLLMQEIFRLAQTEHLPVWIDDRFAHQYERIEQSPIVGTDAILLLLKSRGLLTDDEYYRNLIKLMELNALFLSLDSEMVLHWLRSAETGQAGQIHEAYELKTIRRYFAGAFAEGTSLGVLSPEPGKLSESALYYHQYQSACRDVLLRVWLDAHLSDDRKKAISDWIVNRLWRGVEDVSRLLPNPPTLQETVSASQVLLISVAFNILFRETHSVKGSSGYLCWLYDRFLNTHWAINPEVKRHVISHLGGFFKRMIEDQPERHQRVLLALSASLLAKAPLELVETLFMDHSVQALFKDCLRRTVEISEGLEVPIEDWSQWAFECISLGAEVTVEKNFEGQSLLLQWVEPSPFLPGLRVQVLVEDSMQNTHVRIEPFSKLHHPSPETRKQALGTLLPFLDISLTKAAEVADQLAAQTGWESAAAEVEALANSSWKYFWERLAHLIQARIPTSVDLLFPDDPTMFVTRFSLSPAAIEDLLTFHVEWLVLVQRRVEEDGFETTLTDLLAFPFGEGISSSEIVTRLIDSGNVSRSQAFETVFKFAARSTNPLALQNCLDILLALQEGDTASTDHVQVVMQKLLNPERVTDPTPLVPLYELYIMILRFAWSRMQTLESFRKHPVEERIVWAYAYAGALMAVLDGLRKDRSILSDYTALSQWLAEKIEPSRNDIFQGSFDEQIETSNPVKASRIRTVVSGTLGILLKHKHKLRWLGPELLAKSVFIACQIIQGEIGGAEEIFKPFSSTRNCFGAPFNRNIFSGLKEIFQLIGEDAPGSLRERDRQLIQLIRVFDPNISLSTTLHRIAEGKAWELNDLVSICIALSEPIDLSLVELLGKAVTHLDPSHWSEDQDFGFACLTLARCANASSSIEVRSQVLEKLRDAWLTIAGRAAQYIAIMNAVVVVVSNSGGESNASEFYGWWRETIERMQHKVPEEVYEIALSLSWWIPISQQQGLSSIKSRLTVLL